MKYLIYSAFIALSIASIKSQELKKVYSIAKEIQDVSWYEEQQRLWKEEIDKNNKNAVAWENYYNATKALRNLSWSDKELNKKYIEITQKIADEVIKTIPNTYQANLIVWRNSGNDKKALKYLEKAYELNPYHEFVLVNMLTQAMLMGKEKEYSDHCNQYYKTNDISSGLLNWGYNLLAGLDKNAIVFTSGDNDTYPCWLIQEVKNFRTDVKVLNTYLLLKDDYRNRLFKELNLPELDLKMSASKTQEDYQINQEKIFEHIFKNYKNSVYVVSPSVFKKEYEDKLYLTGLAYKYSETDIDNISLIIRNYEKRYLLDYLKITLSFNIGNKVAENSQQMYLSALTKLYKHYKNTEQSEKLKEVVELMILIGERTGSSEYLNEIFGE